jgi:hypothetical protein
MKNLHTTVRYYGGNSPKVKARKLPSKIPGKNWYYGGIWGMIGVRQEFDFHKSIVLLVFWWP